MNSDMTPYGMTLDVSVSLGKYEKDTIKKGRYQI
jgi:hypothetical protein